MVIDFFLTVFNVRLIPLCLLVLFVIINISWIFLFLFSIRAYLHTPKVISKHFYLTNEPSSPRKNKNNRESNLPFLSIIIPARNEQDNIERCIISLLHQDYPDFEVILVDDNSTDNTLKVVRDIKSQKEGLGRIASLPIERLKIISLTEKPEKWTGKTWASEQGYLHSSGKILLFTDADTCYTKSDALSQTVRYMLKQNLDVLTGLPLIELRDFWSRITLPLWNHFSILLGRNTGTMNNPKSKVAYLVGAFFLIRKKVLSEVATFRSVREAIQEDAELGMRIKNAGYKIKIVTIDNIVSALWSRDLRTIWFGIARTFVSMNKWQIFVSLIAVFFMAMLPFILLPYTLSLTVNTTTITSTHWMVLLDLFQKQETEQLTLISFYLNIVSCLLIIASTAVKDVKRYRMIPTYSLLSFLGATLIVALYIVSIVRLFSRQSLLWRGRKLITTIK